MEHHTNDTFYVQFLSFELAYQVILVLVLIFSDSILLQNKILKRCQEKRTSFILSTDSLTWKTAYSGKTSFIRKNVLETVENETRIWIVMKILFNSSLDNSKPFFALWKNIFNSTVLQIYLQIFKNTEKVSVHNCSLFSLILIN